MRRAVYNSGIPDNRLKSVHRSALGLRALRFAAFLSTLVISLTALAADWSVPEQQLARKIAAVTGPGTVALTIESHSSLSRRDSEVVQNGLRAALEQSGLHFVKAEQAVASVTITLSENVTSYVWVAQIHQSATESAVAMVAIPRSGRVSAARDTMPITLRKTFLWSQNDPILDVAILEENGAPARIAVLDSENVSFYRWQGGKWQAEQVLAITHARPWPQDLRGRLVLAKDHLLDAYLPGVICRAGAEAASGMNCRESDDPWPIVPPSMLGSASVFPSAGSSNVPSAAVSQVTAFFAPTRNFFTGVLTPAVGKFSTVPKFYSAGFVPRDRYMLWLFASTDGKVHMVDGMSDQASKLDWGTDIATVRTNCGAGWQVLAANSGEQLGDAVRAYEFPDRDPVAVSSAVDFPGELSALWTESRGDSAIAIVNNRETGSYEAYRLAVACGQ
jgi:hypothetical protein